MVRYILALSVVLAHYKTLVGLEIPFPLTSYDGVSGFFTLSGFLLCASYVRKHTGNVRTYIFSRARRILPAYWSTVLLFAIGLAWVSNLGLLEYFTSAHFWKYLAANLCFLNFLEPSLPGVFSGLEMSAVNGSLWTMKVEWLLYLSLPVVMWVIRRHKKWAAWLLSAIYIFAVVYQYVLYEMYFVSGKEIYNIMGRQVFGQLSFFYAGAALYLWFDIFNKYRNRFMVFAVGLLVLEQICPELRTFVRPIAISVLVIWLSMTGKWGTWEGKYDNMSYNIYLVHFPVMQLIAYYELPRVVGGWGAFAIGMAAIVLISALMIYFIEKPIRKWIDSRRLA